MREKLFALFVFVCGLIQPHLAFAVDFVVSDVYGGEMHLSQDVLFSHGIIVQPSGVFVDTALRMQNMADVRSDIYVCANCDFHIQNSGEVYGRIHLGNGSEMTQIVRSTADITFLDADAPYVVLVDGVRDMEWGDLFAIGMNAGTLVLRDSDVVFSGAAVGARHMAGKTYKIILDGVVTLRISDAGVVRDGVPLMQNVYGNASVVVGGLAPGELYAYVAKIENNDLYVTTVRETDYYKILGDERGRFLNLVRSLSPDDALLRRLDTAKSMDELRYIMSHSVAFNPGLLTRPIRDIDRFMADGISIDSGAAGVVPRTFYIANSDYDIYGATIDLNAPLRAGFSGGISVYGAMAESDDEINEFSAQVFGGNFHAAYDMGQVRARGVVGATYGDFDVPYVFDAGRIRSNLRAMSIYGAVDAGLAFGIFVPYVGAEYHTSRVLNARSVDAGLRAGIDAVGAWHGETGTYKIKIGAGLNSRLDIKAGVAIGFYSPDDMIGGDVALNIIQADNGGYSGMLSFSVKVEF